MPDIAAIERNLAKRSKAAGFGADVNVSARIASTVEDIGQEIWDYSNFPPLAYVMRAIRMGFVPTRDEVLAAVARLDLPGPTPTMRHRRRSWFGILANGGQKERTLAALGIFRIEEPLGRPKKIVDKLRPFGRTGRDVLVQSLYTGDECARPTSWFRPEPAINSRGFVVAKVRRPQWQLVRRRNGGW